MSANQPSESGPFPWRFPEVPGNGTLVAGPPWHLSGRFLAVDFQADADRLAEHFPAGIEPIGDGSASVVFADWSSRSEADPRLQDPARGQHREAYVVGYGIYRDRKVARVLAIWVDNDLSMVRGHIQGFPKRLGLIHMTNEVDVGTGGSYRAPGHRFLGSCSMLGRAEVDASITLSEEFDGYPAGVSTPLLHTRYWPSVSSGVPDVDELSFGTLQDFSLRRVYSGQGAIKFHSTPYSDLENWRPVEVGTAYYGSIGFSITGGTREEAE